MTTGRSDAASQANPARRRWCDGLPAVTAVVECGGQRHRITWRRGRLVLEDHDVLAERSLTALGAEPPLCLDVLDAWRRVRDSGRLHALLVADRAAPPAEAGRRPRAETVEMGRFTRLALSPTARRFLERHLAERLEGEMRRWETALIQALPAALRRTLALSVIVGAGRQWHDEDYRRAHGRRIESVLVAITSPLLEQSARRWRRNLKPYASFAIASRLLAPGEQPTCAASVHADGGFAELSLPLSWFTEIWARGVALVDDCFVLGRAGGSPDAASLPVLAVRWQREAGGKTRALAGRAMLSRGDGEEWCLHWA